MANLYALSPEDVNQILEEATLFLTAEDRDELDSEKMDFASISSMVTNYVDRLYKINHQEHPEHFDPLVETFYYEIDNKDLIALKVLNAESDDPVEFGHAKALFALDTDDQTGNLVNTVILVAYDKGAKMMKLGKTLGNQDAYGLERWKPRKSVFDALKGINEDNSTAVANHLFQIFHNPEE